MPLFFLLSSPPPSVSSVPVILEPSSRGRIDVRTVLPLHLSTNVAVPQISASSQSSMAVVATVVDECVANVPLTTDISSSSLLAPGESMHERERSVSDWKYRTPWTSIEDEIVIKGKDVGLSWAKIAKQLPGRTLYAAHNRWRVFLSPDSVTWGNRVSSWREDEVEVLIEGRKEGLSWKKIAEQLPGRSAKGACKQHKKCQMSVSPEGKRGIAAPHSPSNSGSGMAFPFSMQPEEEESNLEEPSDSSLDVGHSTLYDAAETEEVCVGCVCGDNQEGVAHNSVESEGKKRKRDESDDDFGTDSLEIAAMLTEHVGLGSFGDQGSWLLPSDALILSYAESTGFEEK